MTRLTGEAAEALANDVFNRTIRHRPAVVVDAADAAEVLAAVRLAAERSLPVAVQATGHGMARAADDAVLVSTRRLTGVRIDPDTRTARIEAGVRAGQLIAEAAKYGLAPLNGASPVVGVVGYTLGGGLGPLGRAYGFSADNVRELDTVTADGKLVTASPEQHEDLFWATRGGKGNFGVVTAMELELVAVTRLYGGGLFFPGEAAADVLHAYREWTATVPDELTSSVALLRLPPLEAVPEPLRGRFVVHVRIAYLGSAADGERLVAPLREVAPALIDTVRELPYTEVASIHQDPTDPGQFRDRSGLLRTLEAATVDALLDRVGPDADNPVPVVELRHLGGALGRPPQHANAVGFREAKFSLFTTARAGPEEAAAAGELQRSLLDALAPWRLGGPFVSFMGVDQAGAEDVRAAYEPDTFQRLRVLKAAHDPDNLFRINHNIQC